MKTESHKKATQRRKYRVRKKVLGTPERPRLAVFRSNRHIYAQIIDDIAGVTLASCGTRSKAVRDQIENAGNQKAAKIIGETLAKEALNVGIRCVSFDRSSFKYHGRVKSLADGAREAGLVF